MVGSGYVGITELQSTTYLSWILTPFQKMMTYLQHWQVVNHLVNLISAMHTYNWCLTRNLGSLPPLIHKEDLFSINASSLVFHQPPPYSKGLWTCSLLQGIPQTCVYLDDILITGTTMEEHLKTWMRCCVDFKQPA